MSASDDEDMRRLGLDLHGDIGGRLRDLDGSMLVKFVLLMEAVGTDGQRSICATHSDDIKSWETLGMLEYMRAFESAAIGPGDDL